MLKRIFSLFLSLLIFTLPIEAKLPEIFPRDVKRKINEVLKAHVSHKKFSKDLILRALRNYLEELDPSKTYFLANEIAAWTTPNEDDLESMLQSFEKGKYTPFEEIYQVFLQAIERRNRLENNLESLEISPEGAVKLQEELPWAKDEEQLFERLKMIRGLQLEAALKLQDESQQTFFDRIKKRRLIREARVIGESEQESQKWILTHILKASVAALDSHTNYFTPSEANQFMIQVQQRLFGIGVQLKDNLNGFSVERILEGGPAFLNNRLKVKDLIIAVNHDPIVGMDILEAVELIRGEKGTPVTLTVARETKEGPQTFDVELTRGEVVLEESRLETKLEPFADGTIAHLRLYSFYQDGTTSSALDLKRAIEKTKREDNLKGVILDLRSNAGGILPQAVEVAGLFIQKGIVASIKDNSGKVQHLRNIQENVVWDGPLLILTNRGSASASEIVAQALQDYGRAFVIGDDKTYGKGTIQTFTLDASSPGRVNPKGEFKVTRGRYYTVSGKSPQLKGVQSDIVVPGILSHLDIGEEFAKFPLENDSIDEQFEDDLSDIPKIHRAEISKIYKHNLQKKMDVYSSFLPILKANSENRIKMNESYQTFLEERKKKKFDFDAMELFGHDDFQLAEAMSIMKDFIFLLQIQ